MTSLRAVRDRYAHNQGYPFADVLTEADIRVLIALAFELFLRIPILDLMSPG
jgi:hypothetical protein